MADPIRSERIVVLAPHKLAWLPGIVAAALVAPYSAATSAGFALASLLLGAALLKPVRFADDGAGAVAIGVLHRGRWEWWRPDQIEEVRYVHRLRMLRGTARLELTTVDDEVVALPGTTGRMLLRPLGSERDEPGPTGWLSMTGTRNFLRLVERHLGVVIDTRDAEWFSPGLPS